MNGDWQLFKDYFDKRLDERDEQRREDKAHWDNRLDRIEDSFKNHEHRQHPTWAALLPIIIGVATIVVLLS